MLIMIIFPIVYSLSILNRKSVGHIMGNMSPDVFVERIVRKVIWWRSVKVNWLIVFHFEIGRYVVVLVKLRVVDNVIRRWIHKICWLVKRNNLVCSHFYLSY